MSLVEVARLPGGSGGAFSRDGARFALAGDGNLLQLFDTRSWDQIDAIPVPSDTGRVCFVSDDLVVMKNTTGQSFTMRLSSGEVARLPGGATGEGAIGAIRSGAIEVGWERGLLWRSTDGLVVERLETAQPHVYVASIDRSGRWCIVASQDQAEDSSTAHEALELRDVDSWMLMWRLDRSPTEWVGTVAVDIDARLLISEGFEIATWSAAGAVEVRRSFDSPASSVAWMEGGVVLIELEDRVVELDEALRTQHEFDAPFPAGVVVSPSGRIAVALDWKRSTVLARPS